MEVGEPPLRDGDGLDGGGRLLRYFTPLALLAVSAPAGHVSGAPFPHPTCRNKSLGGPDTWVRQGVCSLENPAAMGGRDQGSIHTPAIVAQQPCFAHSDAADAERRGCRRRHRLRAQELVGGELGCIGNGVTNVKMETNA